MAYDIYTDPHDPNLLWLRFYDHLTWDEYLDAFSRLVARIQTMTARTDVLLHVEAPIPAGDPLPYFRRVLRDLGDLSILGIFVSVDPGAGLFARLMVGILTRLYIPKMTGRTPFVTSVEAARQVIAAERARAGFRLRTQT